MPDQFVTDAFSIGGGNICRVFLMGPSGMNYKTSISPTLLTAREQEVLELIAVGLSAKQVAQRIDLAPRTVERHIENIRQKMRARNTPHLIFQAFQSGMLEVAGGQDEFGFRASDVSHGPLADIVPG
jgi:DNA-binding CsgD family transcriptional regulator